MAGYTFIFQYGMHDADKKIITRIDASSYNNDDLLQIKLPLNMPYLTNNNYERVNGDIEYNGVHYNYVKRKVYNDTLYLMCLPNLEKTQLSVAKIDFTKAVNDAPSSKKDAAPIAKKTGCTSEYTTISSYSFNNNIVSAHLQNIFIASNPVAVFINMPVQPPDFSC
jgi:hypothetical protein